MERHNSVNQFFMCLQHRRRCITVEDKDPSILWSHDPLGLLIRWLKLLLEANHRWSVVPLSREAALFNTRIAYDCALPPNMQRNRGYSTYIYHRNIPYAFPSVKRKCWQDTEGNIVHVCSKSGHSCYRNLVSFATIPGKIRYRYSSRAIQVLIQRVLANRRTLEALDSFR